MPQTRRYPRRKGNATKFDGNVTQLQKRVPSSRARPPVEAAAESGNNEGKIVDATPAPLLQGNEDVVTEEAEAPSTNISEESFTEEDFLIALDLLRQPPTPDNCAKSLDEAPAVDITPELVTNCHQNGPK